MSIRETEPDSSGALPCLGLSEISPKLVKPGADIESMPDPRERLIALWTVIGQYRFLAESGDQPVHGIAHQQVMNVWAKEHRRVFPTDWCSQELKNGPEKKVQTMVQEGDILLAFQRLCEERSEAPEFIHPDRRFWLYDTLERMAKDNQYDLLADLIKAEMIGETLPGGFGYCDNSERLHRYVEMQELDDSFETIVNDFIDCLNNTGAIQRSDYFEPEENSSLDDICRLVKERSYKRLAEYLIKSGRLDLDHELQLLPCLDQ